MHTAALSPDPASLSQVQLSLFQSFDSTSIKISKIRPFVSFALEMELDFSICSQCRTIFSTTVD